MWRASPIRFSSDLMMKVTLFVENEAAPFRSPDPEYAIRISGNAFHDAGDRVAGAFYGPAHEEMAGVLEDRSPRST